MTQVLIPIRARTPAAKLAAGVFRPEQCSMNANCCKNIAWKTFKAFWRAFSTGVVKIMKSTHHDVRVKGEVIASLGCLLEQASVLVLRMRNVYDKVERTGP